MRAFEFVQGLGEYLPFRSSSLDQVLFATSLDHMLVPRRALAEAQRVIRPGGAVNVWFGEVDRGRDGRRLPRLRAAAARLLGSLPWMPSPTAEPAYIAALDRPDGAIDKFHVAHPGEGEISGWFAEAGLRLQDVERIDYGSGCFMRGVKSQRSPA